MGLNTGGAIGGKSGVGGETGGGSRSEIDGNGASDLAGDSGKRGERTEEVVVDSESLGDDAISGELATR